jgi:branched-chain amino acid transport system ATP-binding protein
MAQLEVRNLSKFFGGVKALQGVDLEVDQGEIIGLIGPNGAGKSTLFNCIAGYFRPSGGKIFFKGKAIQGRSPHLICRLGIARTFQIPRIFLDMSVLENVMLGALNRVTNVNKAREIALRNIELSGLSGKEQMIGKELTIADKKRLEVARAMATEPSLLLLDEAMAGLTPVEQEEAVELVRKIHNLGITVILVEHVMEVVMPISQRVVVLNQGIKLCEDVPEKIVKDPRVIECYLGERYNVER